MLFVNDKILILVNLQMYMRLDEITQKMKEIEGWSLHTDYINKEFEFETFIRAINFVNRVAEVAEKNQHHPDIIINYKKVQLSLSTHDEGGLSEKDFIVAKEIDSLLG